MQQVYTNYDMHHLSSSLRPRKMIQKLLNSWCESKCALCVFKAFKAAGLIDWCTSSGARQTQTLCLRETDTILFTKIFKMHVSKAVFNTCIVQMLTIMFQTCCFHVSTRVHDKVTQFVICAKNTCKRYYVLSFSSLEIISMFKLHLYIHTHTHTHIYIYIY